MSPTRRAESGHSTLSHVDASGEASMVDVSAKAATVRRALAEGRILMSAGASPRCAMRNSPRGT
jgi:cyclic pyranopterin monophosphate synthase